MLPTQNPAFAEVPSRLSSDFSDFDSSHSKPPVPTCGPPGVLGGFEGLSRVNISSAVVFTLFWVIFDVITAKIETELSCTFTESIYKHKHFLNSGLCPQAPLLHPLFSYHISKLT